MGAPGNFLCVVNVLLDVVSMADGGEGPIGILHDGNKEGEEG